MGKEAKNRRRATNLKLKFGLGTNIIKENKENGQI
jgi:hypothetical protein